MAYDYKEWLMEKLIHIQSDLGVSNFRFVVGNEQIFAKNDDEYDDEIIYVVIKYLSSSKSLDSVIQPIQLVILGTPNGNEYINLIFGKLFTDYNFFAYVNNGTFVKHQYTSPVVLSNLNDVRYQYRSIFYMSATLYIMDGVLDINCVKNGVTYRNSLLIDNEVIEITNASISYAMTSNTQAIPGNQIASSLKSVATFQMSFTLPLLGTYTAVDNILDIMNGSSTGDKSFVTSFKIGNVAFSYNLKLISAQLTTAPNQVPGLLVGLMV